jgi:hypothetical protein
VFPSVSKIQRTSEASASGGNLLRSTLKRADFKPNKIYRDFSTAGSRKDFFYIQRKLSFKFLQPHHPPSLILKLFAYSNKKHYLCKKKTLARSQETGEPSGVENLEDGLRCDVTKLLRNGQLLIIYNGNTYRLDGQQIQ